MKINRINQYKREKVDMFIKHRWFSMFVDAHGETFNLGIADGYYIGEEDNIIGLITYRIDKKEMEILSLDSCHEHIGIGTKLINSVIKEAKKQGCSKITLITTNDNVPAILFYQKRGFDIAEFNRNAINKARKRKPEIPLTGMYGIPIKHEIKMELVV